MSFHFKVSLPKIIITAIITTSRRIIKYILPIGEILCRNSAEVIFIDVWNSIATKILPLVLLLSQVKRIDKASK